MLKESALIVKVKSDISFYIFLNIFSWYFKLNFMKKKNTSVPKANNNK